MLDDTLHLCIVLVVLGTNNLYVDICLFVVGHG